MSDRCGMSISADSPSDETLNRGPLALLLRRQYEFPIGINIVQFSIFQFSIFNLWDISQPSFTEKNFWCSFSWFLIYKWVAQTHTLHVLLLYLLQTNILLIIEKLPLEERVDTLVQVQCRLADIFYPKWVELLLHIHSCLLVLKALLAELYVTLDGGCLSYLIP